MLLAILVSLLFSKTFAQYNETIVLSQKTAGPYGVSIISSKPYSENDRSAYYYQISVSGFPYVRSSYYSNINDTAQADFSFRMGHLRLVEFLQGSSPATNAVSACSFVDNTGQWSYLNMSDISTGEFDVVRNISTTFTGAGACAGLSVGYDVFVSNNITSMALVQGGTPVILLPQNVYYVFRISGYPYKSAGSQLAVVGAMFSLKARDIFVDQVSSIKNTVASGEVILTGVAKVNDNAYTSVVNSPLYDPDGSAISTDDDGANSAESYSLIYFQVQATQPSSVIWGSTLAITLNNGTNSTNSTDNGTPTSAGHVSNHFNAVAVLFVTFAAIIFQLQ